jgi:hypothetical protein
MKYSGRFRSRVNPHMMQERLQLWLSSRINSVGWIDDIVLLVALENLAREVAATHRGLNGIYVSAAQDVADPIEVQIAERLLAVGNPGLLEAGENIAIGHDR